MHEDWSYLIEMDSVIYEKYDFDLAKLYMTLYTLFGSHQGYDDYKCSFSYRFKLTIKRDEKKYNYLLSIMDIKGNAPYFTFYRKTTGDEQPGVYQDPINEEFSKEEMQECMAVFVMFLFNFYSAYKPFFNQPFYRVNEYAHLIYGFKKGSFFYDYFPPENEQSHDQFLKAKEKYKADKSLDNKMSAW